MPRQTVNESTDANTFNKAAAPQVVQAAVPEAIEQMAVDRYKVVPSHESMFHRWAVVAGNGTQQLYIGREVECQNMARKFAGAFLDGAFVAMQRTAPQPASAAQGDAIEHELAMLIRRIVSSARRNCEDESNVLKLANEAWAYLVRKGLNGSPLRDAGIESDPTPPAKAADSVQEDAASAGFFLQLPQRPKPEAPAGTIGIDWDAYSGAQMLAYGRDCSNTAIVAAQKPGGL